MGKKKKRVEDIKVTDAAEESNLSEEELEEVSGGLGRVGGGLVGVRGMVADTSLTKSTELTEATGLEDSIGKESFGVGLRGMRG